MKIIMLYGKSHCGKTSTLNLVYKDIYQASANIIEQKKYLRSDRDDDFECIIRFRNKNIAFFTMGDYSCCLLEAFKRFVAKCDILICACNDRFVKPRKQMRNNIDVVIEKQIADSHNQVSCELANNSDKEKIINSIT